MHTSTDSLHIFEGNSGAEFGCGDVPDLRVRVRRDAPQALGREIPEW